VKINNRRTTSRALSVDEPSDGRGSKAEVSSSYSCLVFRNLYLSPQSLKLRSTGSSVRGESGSPRWAREQFAVDILTALYPRCPVRSTQVASPIADIVLKRLSYTSIFTVRLAMPREKKFRLLRSDAGRRWPDSFSSTSLFPGIGSVLSRRRSSHLNLRSA
jgi:hypothetical protein